MKWEQLNVLVTGGTGSFGKKLVETMLRRHAPRKLIIFSRDELKQYEMQQVFSESRYPCLRYFLGDVRDKDRLHRAFDEVDIVIHAAALKQVPAAEYNPFEFIKTNILGAANIIDAAIDCGVQKVIALSTDKAASPINLYGATKLCSDKLFITGNFYSGRHLTKFSVVRYGNVVGSRGSVVPFFLKQRSQGLLPITDSRMTRFWITLQQGVDFVLASLERMEGQELFVPKIPSMNIMDLAEALAPGCPTKLVGIRPGEKLHESLITIDDARSTYEFPDYYTILPNPCMDGLPENFRVRSGVLCPEGFSYISNTNKQWLSVGDLRQILDKELQIEQNASL